MKTKHTMAAIGLMILSLSVDADLARVGPTNIPSPAGHGFPNWYQDLNGTVLDICLPDAVDPGALQQSACLLVGVDPPYSFPNNFPDEDFYFRATSLVDMPPAPGGLVAKRATLVLALEGAFSVGAVAVGDQVVFTRIRVFAGVPEPGIYTVTHPYGVETFPVDAVAAGNRDITFSEDVGVARGVFDGALHSRLGPFLQRADSLGAPLGPVTLNGAQFLSDGLATEFVTGSPFGANYFEICGERADGSPIILGDQGVSGTCVRSDQFSLTGRLHDFTANPIPSPLDVYNGFYRRDAAGTQVDIYARDIKALPSQPNPSLTVATTNIPPVKMIPFGPPALGQYYTQGMVDPGGELPGPVSVINSADTPPSLFTKHVVDIVTVAFANYDYTNQTLSVVATSSDKGFVSTGQRPPTLSLEGYSETAVSTNNANDPAEVTITVTGVQTPPDTVTVISTAGGSKTFFIARNQATGVDTPVAGVPFTQNDSASAIVAGPAINIPVTANDVANPAAPITSLQLVGTAIPVGSGSAVVNGADITYTPGTVSGDVSFQYAALNSVGQSNIATVTVTVIVPTPIANSDGPVTVDVKLPIVIDVLTNDSGNGGTLNPGSVVVSNVTGGTATANATGQVAYTAGALVGNFGFDYTVANTNGQVSAPAHVTVTLTGPAPIVNPDGPVTVAINQSGVIDVLGNDSGNGGTLNSASVVVSNVTGGAATVDATGKVTFAAGATAGDFGFDYTVANDNGMISQLAHVSVTVILPVPIANPDGPVTVIANQSGVIDVLANDSGNGGTLNPATVVVSNVTGGATTSDATGKMTFAAGATAGTFGFDYTVANDNGKVSSLAHVTVTVVLGPAPIASSDGPVSVAVNQSGVINVLTNDFGNGGTLNPATVVVSNVTGGAATVDATGKVTFAAGSTAGAFGFDYTVANTNGRISQPAHVTMTVFIPEVIGITSATCRRVNATTGLWRVTGTSSVQTNNSIQLYRTASVPADLTTNKLGTAIPVVSGLWRFSAKRGPTCTTPISLRSSATGAIKANIAVTLN